MEAKLRNSLSDFPDDILHHIFSFLEFKDVALLRAVSRRFQTLCMSAPSFSFSQHPPYSPNCSCQHVFNFMKKLPRKRPHNLKIDRLSFSSLCMERKHNELHKRWLHKLLQAFLVDKLSLEHSLPSIFPCLPRLQSLKILKLNMTKPVYVRLPDDEMKLASLERLHVENIETQDSVGRWVSQSFPSLKRLLLCRVACVSRNGLDLTIGSSCLEDLTIDCCCGFKTLRIITNNLLALSYADCTNHNYGFFCNYCKENDVIATEVCEPNLQRFEWKGAPRRLYYDKMTFKNLHVATITSLNYHNRYLLPQFFEAMGCAEILCVDSHTIERLYGEPLISFRDIRHLQLQVRQRFYKGNTRDVLTHFLEKLPNLETLILAPWHGDEVSPCRRPFSFEIALRECRKIRWKKIRGLKKVNIRIETMYHAMALMMGMLKKSCVDMEEMSLSYPSYYHKSIKNYLNCVESASSTLLIKLSPPNRKRKRYSSQYNSVDSSKKRI